MRPAVRSPVVSHVSLALGRHQAYRQLRTERSVAQAAQES
jgi:hypothetical protein